MSAPISVILPFYRGDRAEHLNLALQSVLNQTLKASEIVLIQDGPVSQELDQLLSELLQHHPEIKHLVLEKNQGLSAALNAGIEAASQEWLARMDADDICEPERFEKQWQQIQADPELAIIGSWIDEYDEQMQERLAIRKSPKEHAAIRSYAAWRCPFNHMTVMYRKSVLLELGKYKDFGAVGDDYELWARFLMKGYKAHNIQESLVKARTGTAMFSERRRGLKYLRNEIRELNALYQLGLLKPWHYLFHFSIKSVVRLAPAGVVKWIYKGIRKTS